MVVRSICDTQDDIVRSWSSGLFEYGRLSNLTLDAELSPSLLIYQAKAIDMT